MEITYIGAFLAGLASFLTPCILPLVPFYLSYLAGSSAALQAGDVQGNVRSKLLVQSLAFSAGMISIFVLLGASASMIGHMVRDFFPYLQWVAAGLLVAMGLHFLGIFRIPFLELQARPDTTGLDVSTVPGAYLMGLAFAFGWTPCVGPVLALILILAARTASATEGMVLLTFYGMGMCLPFVAASLLMGPLLRVFKNIQNHSARIEKANGLVLVAFGILVGTGAIGWIGNWMLMTFPVFQGLG